MNSVIGVKADAREPIASMMIRNGGPDRVRLFVMQVNDASGNRFTFRIDNCPVEGSQGRTLGGVASRDRNHSEYYDNGDEFHGLAHVPELLSGPFLIKLVSLTRVPFISFVSVWVHSVP